MRSVFNRSVRTTEKRVAKLLGESAAESSPSTYTAPPKLSSWRVILFKTVDLPAPLGPMRETTSPAPMLDTDTADQYLFVVSYAQISGGKAVHTLFLLLFRSMAMTTGAPNIAVTVPMASSVGAKIVRAMRSHTRRTRRRAGTFRAKRRPGFD